MIEKIACNVERRDEEPNIAVAERLVNDSDKEGIAEMAEGLSDKKEQVANDCIKVLYEIGYRNPSLIVPYAEAFVEKLKSKNNRLVWGSCIALAQIAEMAGDCLYKELGAIYDTYRKGSVITVDNCISIFAGIARSKEAYEKKIFSILIEHLEHCRPKEVAQHAERAYVCVNRENAPAFKAALKKRYGALVESQKKRVDKLRKKIEKEEF
jgi:DNA-binding FrmR family transcriptional regulator